MTRGGRKRLRNSGEGKGREGEQRAGAGVGGPPICDIMADTLSVLYGTTENRNDKECGAASHQDSRHSSILSNGT